MARFTIATWGNASRFRVQNKENLLAYFDFIDTETGLEYQDWQLMNSKNGMFVSAPGKKSYTNGKGKTVFPKYVAPAFDDEQDNKRNPKGDAFFQAVAKMAIAAYEAAGDAPATRPTAKAGSGRRSGAGPVIPDMGTDTEEFPF